MISRASVKQYAVANSNATITVVALLLNKPVLSYGNACSYFKYFLYSLTAHAMWLHKGTGSRQLGLGSFLTLWSPWEVAQKEDTCQTKGKKLKFPFFGGCIYFNTILTWCSVFWESRIGRLKRCWSSSLVKRLFQLWLTLAKTVDV